MKTMKFTDSCRSGLLILIFLLFPICIAYNQKSDKSVPDKEDPEVDPIEGVWKLANQYWVKDDDTLLLGPDEIPIQYKIYLDGYVMWTSEVPYDSSEGHGFGTYKLSNNQLKEKYVSMSFSAKEKMGSKDELIYQIELNDTSCKQTTNSLLRGTIYQLVKEWKKLH